MSAFLFNKHQEVFIFLPFLENVHSVAVGAFRCSHASRGHGPRATSRVSSILCVVKRETAAQAGARVGARNYVGHYHTMVCQNHLNRLLVLNRHAVGAQARLRCAPDHVVNVPPALQEVVRFAGHVPDQPRRARSLCHVEQRDDLPRQPRVHRVRIRVVFKNTGVDLDVAAS